MKNKRASELFLKYLKLSTSPVALKMCTGRDEHSAKVKLPRKEWGVDFRVCQVAQVARRKEFTVAVPRDEMPCPTGSVALGFFKPNALYWSSLNLSPPYMRQEARKVLAKNTPKLTAGKYEFMLVAPLDKGSFKPDLIVIYGNPGQITLLIQAAVLKTGEPLTAKTVGGTACSEWISAAIISGKCQYVFPCHGERIYGALDDSEMVFSLPYEKMEEILDALKVACSSKQGRRRYPASRFLIHQGPNPPGYDELLESLRKDVNPR